MSINEPMHYCFIDGKYFVDEYRSCIGAIYEDVPDLDFDRFRDQIPGPFKVFYYDAVPEADLTEDQERKAAQHAEYLARIRSIDGWRVPEGSARERSNRGKREPKLQQKEVDVLLSVQAMKFVAQGVIRDVYLFAGDIDFRPLIEALVDMGAMVTLYAGSRASKELIASADRVRSLDYNFFYPLTPPIWRSGNPKVVWLGSTLWPESVLKRWTLDSDGSAVIIFKNPQPNHGLVASVEGESGSYGCSDFKTLVRFVVHKFGSMTEE